MEAFLPVFRTLLGSRTLVFSESHLKVCFPQQGVWLVGELKYRISLLEEVASLSKK